MHALVRARVPYLPIHVDDIASASGDLKLPISAAYQTASAPPFAPLSPKAARSSPLAIRASTTSGGDPRPNYALADLFGAHRTAETPRLAATAERAGRRSATERFSRDGHTYLRLSPEWRAKVNGPKIAAEPSPSGDRHPVLNGFDETDIFTYGGKLVPLRVDAGAIVPLTFVPPFPTYPPETSWMREPSTNIPGLVVRQKGNSHRRFQRPESCTYS